MYSRTMPMDIDVGCGIARHSDLLRCACMRLRYGYVYPCALAACDLNNPNHFTHIVLFLVTFTIKWSMRHRRHHLPTSSNALPLTLTRRCCSTTASVPPASQLTAPPSRWSPCCRSCSDICSTNLQLTAEMSKLKLIGPLQLEACRCLHMLAYISPTAIKRTATNQHKHAVLPRLSLPCTSQCRANVNRGKGATWSRRVAAAAAATLASAPKPQICQRCAVQLSC